MSLSVLVVFLAVIAFGAYVQTITGFAFGLVVMGGAALTGAVPLPEAAIVVSLLVLVNAAQILWRDWRSTWNPELGLVLLSSLPTVVASYALLEWLAAGNLDLLRIALGLVILLASVQIVRPGAVLSERSSDGSFVLAGIAGGILGGLFATSGPPLVYHLYRQPFPIRRIRETLVAIFAVNSVFRLGVVTASGSMPASALWLAALAVPSVAGATWLARRWPPALSPKALRLLVFALLALSGLSLALPAVVELI